MPSKDCNAGLHLSATAGGSQPKAGCRRLHFLSPDRPALLLRVKPSPRGRAEQSEIRSDEENRRRLRSRRRRARITGIADEKRTAAARAARAARTAAARAARTAATSERTEVASTTRVAAVPPATGSAACALIAGRARENLSRRRRRVARAAAAPISLVSTVRRAERARQRVARPPRRDAAGARVDGAGAGNALESGDAGEVAGPGAFLSLVARSPVVHQSIPDVGGDVRHRGGVARIARKAGVRGGSGQPGPTSTQRPEIERQRDQQQEQQHDRDAPALRRGRLGARRAPHALVGIAKPVPRGDGRKRVLLRIVAPTRSAAAAIARKPPGAERNARPQSGQPATHPAHCAPAPGRPRMRP